MCRGSEPASPFRSEVLRRRQPARQNEDCSLKPIPLGWIACGSKDCSGVLLRRRVGGALMRQPTSDPPGPMFGRPTADGVPLTFGFRLMLICRVPRGMSSFGFAWCRCFRPCHSATLAAATGPIRPTRECAPTLRRVLRITVPQELGDGTTSSSGVANWLPRFGTASNGATALRRLQTMPWFKAPTRVWALYAPTCGLQLALCLMLRQAVLLMFEGGWCLTGSLCSTQTAATKRKCG